MIGGVVMCGNCMFGHTPRDSGSGPEGENSRSEVENAGPATANTCANGQRVASRTLEAAMTDDDQLMEAVLHAEFFLDAGGDAPAAGSETSLFEILSDAGLSSREQQNAVFAALSASRSHIERLTIERCAKVAEDRGEQYVEPVQSDYDRRDGCYDAAKAIRNLLTDTPKGDVR